MTTQDILRRKNRKDPLKMHQKMSFCFKDTTEKRM